MESGAERKERRLQELIAIAEGRIAEGGLGAVKARDLARELGVALGAIYNLVADLDELYLRVASRTLTRLDRALADASAASAGAGRDAACGQLVSIALAYRSFASDNLHLWRALFEHRMSEDKPFPEWALADQLSLFRYILAPLRELMPGVDDEERLRWAQTMFSAVHGMVMLGLEKKFVAVPIKQLDRQIERFVRALCVGLSAEMA